MRDIEFTDWFVTAKRGDRIIYHEGMLVEDRKYDQDLHILGICVLRSAGWRWRKFGAHPVYQWEAPSRPDLHLYQKKIVPGKYQYIAERT